MRASAVTLYQMPKQTRGGRSGQSIDPIFGGAPIGTSPPAPPAIFGVLADPANAERNLTDTHANRALDLNQ
jgi:hypothetical protein